MPTLSLLHGCNFPRCPELTAYRYCAAHEHCAISERMVRDRMRNAPSRKSYDFKWKKYAHMFLMRNPLCVDPYKRHVGIVTLSTDVDHITPHRGDQILFWNTLNHQALCHSCHSYKTATYDGGFGNASSKRKLAPVSGVYGMTSEENVIPSAEWMLRDTMKRRTA